MKIIATLQLLVAATLLCSCTTSHKTYHAPNNGRVKATQKTLTEKVAQARTTASKAREVTLKAQVHAKELIVLSGAVKEKLESLANQVPIEFKPLVEEIQNAAKAQEDKEILLRQEVDNAVSLNALLQQHQQEEEQARIQAVKAADEYAGAAAQLAQDATNEREERIKVEKQLIQQKWFGLLWKIGGGLFILAIIALVVLYFTGKLGVFAARIASKF